MWFEYDIKLTMRMVKRLKFLLASERGNAEKSAYGNVIILYTGFVDLLIN